LQVVPALLEFVNKDPKIAQGKALYVRYGCRGDWPVLQPPDWQPTEPSPTAAFVIQNDSPFAFSDAAANIPSGGNDTAHSNTADGSATVQEHTAARPSHASDVASGVQRGASASNQMRTVPEPGIARIHGSKSIPSGEHEEVAITADHERHEAVATAEFDCTDSTSGQHSVSPGTRGMQATVNDEKTIEHVLEAEDKAAWQLTGHDGTKVESGTQLADLWAAGTAKKRSAGNAQERS
jgi:hypothetical protein